MCTGSYSGRDDGGSDFVVFLSVHLLLHAERHLKINWDFVSTALDLIFENVVKSAGKGS